MPSFMLKLMRTSNAHIIHSMESNEHQEITSHAQKIASLLINCYKNGNKLLVAGNGGSSSEADHLVGELLGRYCKDRIPLPALSLSSHIGALTCIANDFGYEFIFSRQIQALGKTGDICLLLSTSCTSPNILLAAQECKKMQISTIALPSNSKDYDATCFDYIFPVQANTVGEIQQRHLHIIHQVCSLVDDAF